MMRRKRPSAAFAAILPGTSRPARRGLPHDSVHETRYAECQRDMTPIDRAFRAMAGDLPPQRDEAAENREGNRE
jgi:hypothetical protein